LNGAEIVPAMIGSGTTTAVKRILAVTSCTAIRKEVSFRLKGPQC